MAEKSSVETALDAKGDLVGSRGYRVWFLFLLLLIYTSNFADRVILAALGPSIRADLGITATQFGLLGGISFALFYTILGVPIARLAERHNRVNIIAVATVMWSVMTALCGIAGNFVQLLLYRVGVGVGESGLTPPAYSLISDHFPARRRASALSIFLLGIPLGSFLGAVVGGWVAREYGWRMAFFVVGAPGVLLGVLAWLTLKDPGRGVTDPAHLRSNETPSLIAVFKTLARKKSFKHIAIAASLTSFVNFGNNLFVPSYFGQVHRLDMATAGLLFGLMTGLAGLAGTFLGGFGTDRAGRNDRRWTFWMPALGFVCATPFYIFGVMQADWRASFALMLLSSVFFYAWSPALNGALQNMVTARMRATATALLSVIFNLIGTGLGPVFVGFLNDVYARQAFALGDYGLLCRGGKAMQGAAPELASACLAAGAHGVRWAIVTTALIYIWAALHFVLAARHLRDDLLAAAPAAPATPTA